MHQNNFFQEYFCYKSLCFVFDFFSFLEMSKQYKHSWKAFILCFMHFLLLSVSFLPGSFPGLEYQLPCGTHQVFTQMEPRHISATASVFFAADNEF